MYVVRVFEEVNETYFKHDNKVIMCGYKFVNDQIKQDQYWSNPKMKMYYHFFNSREDALAFCEKEAARLNSDITYLEFNDTF